MNDNIIFLGQGKAIGEQKNDKNLYGVRIRERMVRDGKRNGKKYYRSSILWGSSQPPCQLLLFLVNWIWRSSAFICFIFFNITSLCVRDVTMSMDWNTSWFDLKFYLTSTVKKKKVKPKPNAQVFGLFKSYFDQVLKTRSLPCNGQKNLGNKTTENCQLSDPCSICVCVCVRHRW